MINYNLLHKSTVHYEKEGFKRIEAPWLVTEQINDITCPPEATKYYVTKGGKKKTFVASGEQSFLYLINKNFIPYGDYQTITPCMRDDDFDEYHTKYFMKNELIRYVESPSSNDVKDLVSYAESFFLSIGAQRNLLTIRETSPITYDIEYSGIELGSYGMRRCAFCSWVYGTGLAEPRFSRVLNYG